MNKNKEFDVVIVGGGVSGTALLYLLSQYTDLKRLAIIEKASELATLNSHGRNNSQTLHRGDIETNYTLEKALKVKEGAMMVVRYAKKLPESAQILHRFPKMVLAVGELECQRLESRYEKFHSHFSDMELWDHKRIADLEPYVMRNRQEQVLAIGVQNGFSAVNFQALASSFVNKSMLHNNPDSSILLNTKLKNITQDKQQFILDTNQGELRARFVVVSAGAHSLLYAQRMGYGQHFSCLPVSGSFYYAPNVLQGKVYTVQNDKLPFAAIHGDPDLLVRGKTRFGPTAFFTPLLEKGRLRTLPEFFSVFKPDRKVFKVLWHLFRDRDIRRYLMRNMLYEVPLLRRRLFLKEAQKIVPSMQLADLRFATGVGGIRPAIIDKNKQALLLGESKINTGHGLIFNMTPSPGASSCLQNAESDLLVIEETLQCEVDWRRFEFDLKSE